MPEPAPTAGPSHAAGTGRARVAVTIEPLDTLFFRDGRPFEAASTVASGLPSPQTFAGAIRTLLLTAAGCDFEALGAAMREGNGFPSATEDLGSRVAGIGRVAVRGPWFAVGGEPLVPVPASLRQSEEGAVVRLDPLKAGLPGWRPPVEGMRPLWHRGREQTARLDGYLTLAGLERFLEGAVPNPSDILPAEALFHFESRVGIGVDGKRGTTSERLIYSIRLLARRRGVSLYGEVDGPAAALDLLPAQAVPMPLGGEGRRVLLRRMAEAAPWPRIEHVSGCGRLCLLTAPAVLSGGWRPDLPGLVAAAVPGHLALSGWDLARGGPKPNRFAAAAGSVYFLDPDAERGVGSMSLCEAEDAALGFGTYVEGNWSDA